MYFANAWGLLALLALPAIVVIHLYHRRYPRLMVAGAHLWGAEFESRSPGRRLDRLPMTSSLLLELAAALLLALLLAQPRFGALDRAPHLIVVLDNSASMQAREAGGASFRDQAVAELERRSEELGRNSRVTLILTGRRPTMLAGPAMRWTEAKRLVEGWQPGAPRHEFHASWDRAAQLAEQSGRLLFLTDHLPSGKVPAPKGMEIVAFGRPLENVAITAARWTYDSEADKGNVFLRVENLGREAASVRVDGKAGARAVFQRTARIEPGDGASLENEVAGGLGELVVTISAAGDGLPIDNSVTLIEPAIRTVTVGMELPPGSPAAGFVRRVLEHLPDVRFGEPDSAHLVFAPAQPLPPSREELWWLGIGPLDTSESPGGQGKDLTGPYVIEKRHPLMEGVTLGGVLWAGAQPVELSVTPIVSAGPYPLLGRLSGTRATAYLLNIDLARSNIAESPDWPILLANLVELRRRNLPGLPRWNYRLNEEIRFRLPEKSMLLSNDAPGELTLIHEGNSRPVARSRIVEVPPLDETGVYELRDGQRSLGRFAVNFFDPEESTLTELASGLREPAIDEGEATFRIDDRYSWIVLLGLFGVILAVLMDWRVLRSPQ